MKYVALSLLLAASSALAGPPFSVATFEGGNAVMLFNEKGPCEDTARLAIGTKKDGSKDTGCWIPDGSSIQIAWLDGYIDRIPVRAFKAPEES